MATKFETIAMRLTGFFWSLSASLASFPIAGAASPVFARISQPDVIARFLPTVLSGRRRLVAWWYVPYFLSKWASPLIILPKCVKARTYAFSSLSVVKSPSSKRKTVLLKMFWLMLVEYFFHFPPCAFLGLTDVSSIDSAPESPQRHLSYNSISATLKPTPETGPVLMSPDGECLTGRARSFFFCIEGSF